MSGWLPNFLGGASWLIRFWRQCGMPRGSEQHARGPRPAATAGFNGVEIYELLTNVRQALSGHCEHLETFERVLQPQEGLSDHERGPLLQEQMEGIRLANRAVEHSIEKTIEKLIASCGEMLEPEQASLVAYQDKTTNFNCSLDEVNRESLLVHIASSLLEVVRELRHDNQTVRSEVAAGQERLIELITRVNSAEQVARVDVLTQLPNRRAFDEAHERCAEVQRERGRSYCLILLDIDHFKAVNDDYGHSAGDAVLSLIGRILRENCKTSDYACRIGGEEFGVLLPDCDERPARKVAERFRRKIESSMLHFENQRIAVTASCGVAEAALGETRSDLLKRADAALYTSKSRGRNQTCVYPDVSAIPQRDKLQGALT